MQDYLQYKEGLPYGLRKVFHRRKNDIINAIISCFYVPGMFIFCPMGFYLGPKDDPIQGMAYGGLVGLSGMVTSGFLGSSVFGPMYITHLKRQNAIFIEHYSEHLDHFVHSGEIPENCDQLLEDGLRIDAIPYFVQNFDAQSLEKILAGISNDYKLLPGLFSSSRQETPLLLGYQYLAELLSNADIKPEQFVSVFSPERCPDDWPVWVGGNKLVHRYHDKKRYEDEEAFRKLSRFKYYYCGPISNT